MANAMPVQLSKPDIRRFFDSDYSEVTMTIDNSVIAYNYVRNFTAGVSFSEQTLYIVGTKENPTDVTDAIVNISLERYTTDSEFVRIISDYFERGVMPEIGFFLTQSDPNSSIGRQVVYVYDVKISNIDSLVTAIGNGSKDNAQTITATGRLRLLEGFTPPLV